MDQQETPAQVGRYLATTRLFRALIEIVAEIADRDVQDLRDEIKSRIDHSTAVFRFEAMVHPEFQPAILKMDLAIKAALAADEPGLRN